MFNMGRFEMIRNPFAKFNAAVCAANLQMAVARAKMNRNKLLNARYGLEIDIANLIRDGKDQRAYVRAEQLLRSERSEAALDLLQTICEAVHSHMVLAHYLGGNLGYALNLFTDLAGQHRLGGRHLYPFTLSYSSLSSSASSSCSSSASSSSSSLSLSSSTLSPSSLSSSSLSSSPTPSLSCVRSSSSHHVAMHSRVHHFHPPHGAAAICPHLSAAFRRWPVFSPHALGPAWGILLRLFRRPLTTAGLTTQDTNVPI
eukprot:GHVT01047539.1.p1 GENE.GHVT01047539.1~~GHVT01047539.1.p1  ORF type:complete len:257 (-),score=44.60 GHVT01047539.1:220-990(-)